MFATGTPILDSLLLLGPSLILFATALVVMLVEAIVRPVKTSGLMLATMAGLLAALAYTAVIAVDGTVAVSAFGGMVRIDRYGAAFQSMAILSGLFATFMSDGYLERIGVRIGEYYALLLFGVMGMGLMAFANDLMMIFLAIEVMSIAMYILCAIKRADQRAVESGFKYFILGAFSSGILLYGIAFIYGAIGSTSLTTLAHSLQSGDHGALLVVGGALVIVGFGFKVAAAPFHMWAPDVYQGAPTSVTALMSTGVKAASFAAFGRLVFGAMGEQSHIWIAGLWGMAALTMVIGNIAALVQDDLKRMLAYSSIAHAGYLMMALSSVGEGGVATHPAVASLLYYALAYTFMSAGTFAFLTLFVDGNGNDNTDISSINGLAGRHPWIAAALSILLLSLAGIPPTMGFVGKFYLFSAAIQAGHSGLAIVGALGAAAGVYYYLRPLVHMYMKDGHTPVAMDKGALGTLGFACIAVVIFGLMPGAVLSWAEICLQSVIG